LTGPAEEKKPSDEINGRFENLAISSLPPQAEAPTFIGIWRPLTCSSAANESLLKSRSTREKGTKHGANQETHP
jgi:hypothetical protein